jgi:predicted DNA-binding mobile mystery protein A
MIAPFEQLDKRFAELRPWTTRVARPPHGWLRAIRQALGMTTGQLARRINVTQPRINELEKAEVHGNITLHSLERAAEAMGCRVVYMLIPEKPLSDMLLARAQAVAERQLASVEQTMRLEAQEVGKGKRRQAELRQLTEALLRRPARLWDDA